MELKRKRASCPEEEAEDPLRHVGLPISWLEAKKSSMEIETKEKNPAYGRAGRERRESARIVVDLPVEYWPTNGSKSSPGHTVDISTGGLLLSLPEAIEVGKKLGLSLFSDKEFHFISIETEVEVVWRDRHVGNGGEHKVAVKFVDISAENRERLKRYVIISLV
jgi:c-di-GMP-binding flagellar brake protein YcgR